MADKRVSFILTAKDEFSGALAKAERGFSDVKNAVFSFQGAVSGIGLTAIMQQSLQASITLERMGNALRAATGSSAGAAGGLAFVREETLRLGLDLEVAAAGFTSLSASAKGTSIEGQGVRDIFTAVSEASTVLGLSAADTEGAIRAIGQVLSKGKVQAEELRGQLGERLPGAFQIAARAMGVTTGELDKMLSDGKLMADDFLPKFAAELQRTYGDALPAAMHSTQAEINRAKTAMFEAQAALGQALTPAFNDLLAVMTPVVRLTGDFIGGLQMSAVEAAAFMDRVNIIGEIDWSEVMFGPGTMEETRAEVRRKFAAIQQAVEEQKQEIFDRYQPGSSTLPDIPTFKSSGGSSGSGRTPAMSAFEKRTLGYAMDQQGVEEMAAAVSSFQAQMRVKLAEQPPPNLGFASFDIGSHMAQRPEETGDGGIAAAERFADLQASMMTEEQIVQSSYWNRIAIAREARQANVITEQEYQGALLSIESARADEDLAITQRTEEQKNRIRQQQANVGMNILSMLQSGAMKNHRKGFEIAKVAAIAETTINTYRSAVSAYAALAVIPIIGPALGAAAAAAAVAAGLANVSAIQSQSFGGGGGGGGAISPPGYGAGTPGSPIVTQPIVGQQQVTQPSTTVIIQGNLIGEEAYVENHLIPALNAAHGRNVTLEFARS